MRIAFVASVVAAAALFAGVASAHHNKWLFPPGQVLAKESALRQTFQAAGLNISVRCQGRDRARAKGGGYGYHHIVCVTSIGRIITFHFNARGQVIRTVSG